MPLFLGYDPGGAGRHGVVAAHIGADGTFASPPETRTLPDAEEACRWLRPYSAAKALGIDTLLAWSRRGRRACDDALREHYKSALRKHYKSGAVIAQNSLRSSMTINGIIVAWCGRDLGLPLVESHPKLVFRVWLKDRMAGTDFARWHDKLSRRDDDHDHEADALIAAWCASRWWFGDWNVDLYKTGADRLVFPAGRAVYPWPEPVGARPA